MEGEVTEMLPSGIPMTRLGRSSSPSSSAEITVKSGRCWPRFRKGTCITSAVITLSILLIATLVVELRKDPLLVEDCAEANMSRWLPWNQRMNDSRSSADLALEPSGGVVGP
ncbi:hypothetical protein MTO96_036260 [Rhipicephalus appendiculatus]